MDKGTLERQIHELVVKVYQQGYDDGYEDGKDHKRLNEFQVGDEVMNPWGRKGYVSCMNDDELFVIYPGGTTGHSTKCTYEKTGRHVPLLAEWLEQMREWVVE